MRTRSDAAQRFTPPDAAEAPAEQQLADLKGMLHDMQERQTQAESLPRSQTDREIIAARRSERAKKISVIVPVYNEEGNIDPLFKALFAVLLKLTQDFEIIAVNDGSTDHSYERLSALAEEHPEVKVVNFRRNFGQTAAIMAGIEYSAGDVLVFIDSDLQNDPDDIPVLLDKLNEGYDVVSGWRKDRKDAAIRRNFVSRAANRLISWVSGVHLRDYGCTLKAYRADVIRDIRLYGEMHRFIPIYATWMGAKVTEIPVHHHERRFGRSKYGLERTIKVLLDLIVIKFLDKYFAKPIYIFGGFGMLSILVALATVGLMLYWKLFEGVSMILTPLPLFAAMAFLVGAMSILMGLLAEMIVRTYFESQRRGPYDVRNVLNR
jgi:glycosyltransferase involved in cell wall biosynthesis